MDWKLLLKVIGRSFFITIGIGLGLGLVLFLGIMFHDWAKPWDGYVLVSIILLVLATWGVSDSYKAALRKKKQAVAAEKYQKNAGISDISRNIRPRFWK